jgi:hypothetical protein
LSRAAGTDEIGVFVPLMWGLLAAALLPACRGQIERAIELYALASRHPFVARSHWFADVVEQPIVAAAAALPPAGLSPAAIAAARQRGRARDLDATVKELLDEYLGPSQ